MREDVTQTITLNQIKTHTKKNKATQCGRTRKRAKVGNMLATSMDRFNNNMVVAIKKLADRLCVMVDNVKFMKDFYQDSIALTS